MYKIVLATGSLAFLLSGCLPNHGQSYEGVLPDTKVGKGICLGVGVIDARPDIVSGEKAEQVVGLEQTGLVELPPADITTADGLSFAETVERTVQNALEAKGVEVRTVRLAKGTAEREAIRLLVETDCKSVLVVVRQWHAVTFNRTKLDYDLSLAVFDRRGNEMASKSVSGSELTPRVVKQPLAYADQVVTRLYKRKLEELFAAPEIAKALE